MANLKGLASFVAELRAIKANLVNELRHVDAALSVLGKLGGGGANRATNVPVGTARPKRTMSASARRKIAAAQRTRWAKVHAKKAA